MKYFIRLIALPFHMAIIIIFMVGQLFKTSFLFMKYGGELNTYDKKCNPIRLLDVFNKIESTQKNTQP